MAERTKLQYASSCWRNVYEKSVRSDLPEYSKNLYGSREEECALRSFVLTLIKKHFRATPGVAVDVGCGTGSYLRYLRDNGWRCVGIDFSHNMLKSMAAREGLGLVQSTGEEVAVKSNLADLVLCIGMLQTSEKPGATVAEAARLLKPKGVLILVTLRKAWPYELCFFPLAVIMENDRSLRSAQWYYKLVQARNTLVWHDRPTRHPFRRFSVEYLYGLLGDHGFIDVSRNYLGRIRKIPWLLNSQSVVITAIKKG